MRSPHTVPPLRVRLSCFLPTIHSSCLRQKERARESRRSAVPAVSALQKLQPIRGALQASTTIGECLLSEMRRDREREDLCKPLTDSFTHGILKWQNKSTETRLRITFQRAESGQTHPHKQSYSWVRLQRDRQIYSSSTERQKLESLSCWWCYWSCMPSRVPILTGRRVPPCLGNSARLHASVRRMASYWSWTAPNKDYPVCQPT